MIRRTNERTTKEQRKRTKKTKRVVSRPRLFVSFRSVPLSIAFVLSFFRSFSQSVLMGRERRVVNGQSVKNNEEDEEDEEEEDGDDGCRRAPMDDGR